VKLHIAGLLPLNKIVIYLGLDFGKLPFSRKILFVTAMPAQ
jgi:hypothetical protein